MTGTKSPLILEAELLDNEALEIEDKTLRLDWLELLVLELVGELLLDELLADEVRNEDALEITELLDTPSGALPDDPPPQAPKLIVSTTNPHSLQWFKKLISAHLDQPIKYLLSLDMGVLAVILFARC